MSKPGVGPGSIDGLGSSGGSSDGSTKSGGRGVGVARGSGVWPAGVGDGVMVGCGPSSSVGSLVESEMAMPALPMR